MKGRLRLIVPTAGKSGLHAVLREVPVIQVVLGMPEGVMGYLYDKLSIYV